MINGFSSCAGCGGELQLGNIAALTKTARPMAGLMLGQIDNAMEVLAEAAKLDASPSVDQQTSAVIDGTAFHSGFVNSIDPTLLDSMEETLSAGPCDEGERLVSPLRCPKLDTLLPQILELSSKLKLS